MNKFIVALLLIGSTITFVGEKTTSMPDIRLITSVYTQHPAKNEYYNNESKMLGAEWRFRKDLGVTFAYFENSFYKDSFVLSVNKYYTPVKSLDKLYLSLGAGFVKGYYKYNTIEKDGETVVTSKYNTHIADDYIWGASIGAGYQITENFAAEITYVGPYIITLRYKI